MDVFQYGYPMWYRAAMLIRTFSLAACLGLMATSSFSADWLKMPPLEMRGKYVIGLTQQKAMEHCIARGKRLPTVREVAEWAVGKGSQMQESPNKALAWPLEVDHMQRLGFEPVYLHKGRSQVVLDFYFHAKGFKKGPVGNLGKTRIWTDGALVVDNGNAYTFTPGWPTFRSEDSRNIHGVVCVPAQ